MNIDPVCNQNQKVALKKRLASLPRKCSKFTKSLVYRNKENQHRKHSKFQVLRKSICYKILSAPTTHRVLVLKNKNGVETKSSSITHTCGLCSGQCLCVEMKDEEFESFLFDNLQLETENCHVRYMKRSLKTALCPVTSYSSPERLEKKMESCDKIPEDPRINGSDHIEKDLQKNNLTNSSRFSSNVNECDKSDSVKNIISHTNHNILQSNNMDSISSLNTYVDKTSDSTFSHNMSIGKAELKKRVGPDKDVIDSKDLKSIESSCRSNWYTYLPNTKISSKKSKDVIFSRHLSTKQIAKNKLSLLSEIKSTITSRQHNDSKKPLEKHSLLYKHIINSGESLKCSQDNLANVKGSINEHNTVTQSATVHSALQPKDQQIPIKTIPMPSPDVSNILCTKVDYDKCNSMYSSSKKTHEQVSTHLLDPRLDPKRILKRKAAPKEIYLKRVKWSASEATSSNFFRKSNAVKKKKNDFVQNLNAPIVENERLDPRLKYSKMFPNNSSLCEQYSLQEQDPLVTSLALQLTKSLLSSRLSLHTLPELPVKNTCNNSIADIAMKQTRVSPSKLPAKTSVSVPSNTATKCTYSHLMPKMKKQALPELQVKCRNSRETTDFTSKPLRVSPSSLSVKSVLSKAQATQTNENFTLLIGKTVNASVQVSSERQAKRTHDNITLTKTKKQETVPKKKVKYSSNHNLLPSDKCDTNISSVQTPSRSAISGKKLHYNNSSTYSKTNDEISYQKVPKDETTSTVGYKNHRKCVGKNESLTKKSIRDHSSYDTSKGIPSSPSVKHISNVQFGDRLQSSNEKKLLNSFSSNEVFIEEPGCENSTSNLRQKRELNSNLRSKQTCSNQAASFKLTKKPLQQKLPVIPNKKTHTLKQERLSKSQRIFGDYKKKRCEANLKLIAGKFKQIVKRKTLPFRTKISCVNLRSKTPNSILPFDFKVEDSMQVVFHSNSKPRHKNFRLSTVWFKTLCMPLKLASRLSWECCLNFVCSENLQDGVNKLVTAKDIFEYFLQKAPAMHLIKHSSLGLVSIIKCFAIRALKLYKLKLRRKKSNARKCLNTSTESTNHITKIENCLASSKDLQGNSHVNDTDRESACRKIEYSKNKLHVTVTEKFSAPAIAIKKVKWELCSQTSNLVLCLNLENFRKDTILSLLSKKGISFQTLDSSNILMRSEANMQKENAYNLQKQLICNDSFKRNNFLVSDVINKKKYLRSDNSFIYDFLCNNRKTVICFKVMDLSTFCLRSYMLLSNYKSLRVASKKHLHVFQPKNEPIYYIKPEMLPSKLSVTYQMCDNNCSKYDCKCSIVHKAPYTQEKDFKCVLQTLDTSCKMKKEMCEKDTINVFASDLYKSEPSCLTYKKYCVVNTIKMETSNFPQSLIVKENDLVKKVADLSGEMIHTNVQLPASEELPPNTNSTSDLTSSNITLLTSKEQLSNTYDITALNVTSLQLPKSKSSSNGDCITVLNSTSAEQRESEKQSANKGEERKSKVLTSDRTNSLESSCSTDALQDTNCLSCLVTYTDNYFTHRLNPMELKQLTDPTVTYPDYTECQRLLEESSTLSDSSLSLTDKYNDSNSMYMDSDDPFVDKTKNKMFATQESDTSVLESFFDYIDTMINSNENSQPLQTFQSKSTLQTDALISKIALKETRTPPYCPEPSEVFVAPSKEITIPDTSQKKIELPLYQPEPSNNKSVISSYQENSIPFGAQKNSDTKNCSIYAAGLEPSIETYGPNFVRQGIYSPHCSSQFSGQENLMSNISQMELNSLHYSPKTYEEWLLSTFQETSIPFTTQKNFGSLQCSSYASILTPLQETSPNPEQQRSFTPHASPKASNELLQISSKNKSKPNILKKSRLPPYTRHHKTSDALLSSANVISMPVTAPKDTELSDFASSKETISQVIQKDTKSLHFPPEVGNKSVATSRKTFIPKIAPIETGCQYFSSKASEEVLKTSFRETQGKALPDDISSSIPTNKPKVTLELPSPCETVNCDKNLCSGAVAANVFQADCHLKNKNSSPEVLNSAFQGFDLFGKGEPLHNYYKHLQGTGNHTLNLDEAALKDKNELSAEMLESYNFLCDQLDYHKSQLRGLIHMASIPGTDSDMQLCRRIVVLLEDIEGYELACKALLL